MNADKGKATSFNSIKHFAYVSKRANYVIAVNFRKCERGEIFDLLTTRSKCIECPRGSYSYKDSSKNDVFTCEPCPPLARDCYANKIDLYPGKL